MELQAPIEENEEIMENVVENISRPKRKKKNPNRQQNIFDFFKDLKALLFASHNRRVRHGYLLDRFHDVVIIIVLLSVVVFLTAIGFVGIFATPTGFYYDDPHYHTVTEHLMKGETYIKHTYSDFSPHNGRFSFKMRLPYNCTWTGLLMDDFTIYVSVRAKKELGDDWTQVEGLRTNTRTLECLQKDLFTTELQEKDDESDENEYVSKYVDYPACQEMTILYDNPSYKIYEVEIRFDPKEEALYQLGMIVGQIQTRYEMNTVAYTTFEWITRIVFSIISLLYFCIYFVTMLRCEKFSVWSTPQKWLAILLFELIFYHDPLYVLDVYTAWFIFPIVGVVLSMTFVYTLIFYFLVFFHSLFKPPKERTFFNFWLTKLLVVLPMYVLTVGIFISSRLYDYADPSHDSISDVDMFYYVQLVDMLLMFVYAAYLFYYVFKAIGNVRRMRKSFSSRFKVVGGLSFIVVISFVGLSASISMFRYSNPGFVFLVSHVLIMTYFGWLSIALLPSTTVEVDAKRVDALKYNAFNDESDEEDAIAVGGGMGGHHGRERDRMNVDDEDHEDDEIMQEQVEGNLSFVIDSFHEENKVTLDEMEPEEEEVEMEEIVIDLEKKKKEEENKNKNNDEEEEKKKEKKEEPKKGNEETEIFSNVFVSDEW